MFVLLLRLYAYLWQVDAGQGLLCRGGSRAAQSSALALVPCVIEHALHFRLVCLTHTVLAEELDTFEASMASRAVVHIGTFKARRCTCQGLHLCLSCFAHCLACTLQAPCSYVISCSAPIRTGSVATLRFSQWLQVEKGQDALLYMFASSDVRGNSLDDDQLWQRPQ